MSSDDREDAAMSLGQAPPSGGADEDIDELRRRCRAERGTMAPRQTADCAGSDLAEAYENEEDGGS